MISLGLAAARLMGKSAVRLPAKLRMSTVQQLLEQTDSFLKSCSQERHPAKNGQKKFASAGQKFSHLVNRGHQPEHLVVTPKDVMLDLEAVERNALQDALREAGRRSKQNPF